MIPPGEAPSESRNARPVLLVILGGLGDWCIRRVLQHALEFETESKDNVVTLVIDIQPTIISTHPETYEQWMDSADRWIVRRLIEQTAEEVDQPWRGAANVGLRDLDFGFTSRLTVNPMLPDPTAPGAGDPDDAIATFVDLLGGIFRAAYAGDNVAMASSIGLQIKPYLDFIELRFNQNPLKTSESLRRHWPIKSNSTFEEIRARIVTCIAEQVTKVVDASKEKMNVHRNRLKDYLGGYVPLGDTNVYRYWRSEPAGNRILYFPTSGDKLSVEEAMLSRLAQEYRIIVYAATPPNTYPELLQQWSSYAERIAFEKPIAGLLDKNSEGGLRLTQAANPNGVETTKRIRMAVEDASRNPNRLESLPSLSLSSVDHYNSKWTVAAIEWLKRKKIVDHILDRPKRICIQVLEGGLLPRGRFQFYNGVGGALADMLSHLIQPLRAISGYSTLGELLSTLEVVKIKRARYHLNEDFLLAPIGSGVAAQKDLAEKLAKDTETFGVVHLRFKEGPWKDATDVFIRTGKGFLPQSKTMVIEAKDEEGPVALICDIDRQQISLADHGLHPVHKNDLPAREWMVSRKFDVPGLMQDHRFTPDTKEYFAVFSALCSSEELDARFFPSVEDASQACDFFYEALIEHRLMHAEGLEEPDVYQAYDYGEDVRTWLADEAGWAHLGRKKEDSN